MVRRLHVSSVYQRILSDSGWRLGKTNSRYSAWSMDSNAFDGNAILPLQIIIDLFSLPKSIEENCCKITLECDQPVSNSFRDEIVRIAFVHTIGIIQNNFTVRRIIYVHKKAVSEPKFSRSTISFAELSNHIQNTYVIHPHPEKSKN